MRRAAALALALFAGACDAWLTRPVRYNTVEVAVHQRSGAPVAGVPLVLYTGARPMGYGSTDASGHYTFVMVPQGVYGVQLIADSTFVPIENVLRGPISTVVAGLSLTHDTVAHADFTVLRPGRGTISVKLVGDSGQVVPGADVELFDPRTSRDHAATDAGGIVTFHDVSFGLYGVRVTRPVPYRDFVTPADSLYTVRDGIVVDAGSADTLRIPISRCVGTVTARIVDQNGAPVPQTAAVLFGGTLAASQQQRSSAQGTVTFTNVPCVYEVGVQINPPDGYSVGAGRGLNVIDGIKVGNRSTVSLSFTVRKL
jgi:hypothetical protein